jgi:hypothetical protein
MKSEEFDRSSCSVAGVGDAEKRTYKTPKLQQFGQIKYLTQGSSDADGDDDLNNDKKQQSQ